MMTFFELGQLREGRRRAVARISIPAVRAVPLRVPRRIGEAQDEFIFHQDCHLQLPARHDPVNFHVVEAPRIGFGLIYQQQRALHPQRVIELPETALAPQMQGARYCQVENRPELCVPAPLHDYFHLPQRIVQPILQPPQTRYRQLAVESLFRPRKLQTIDDSLCEHKRRMIVFLRCSVKEDNVKMFDLAET